MNLSIYLILNIAIISIPLFFSFDKNVRYYTKFFPLSLSILVVSTFYIVWDVIFTANNIWSFNPVYLIGLTIFNLPLEEVLFFVTVPYSCVFIYEVVKFYLNDKTIEAAIPISLISTALIFITGLIFISNTYTSIVLIVTSAFFVITYFINQSLLRSSVYWISMLLTLIPFLIVNYILTSLPVVMYNPNEITELYAVTIPAEDFFYSFSLISFYILVYEIFMKRFIGKSL